MKNCVNCGAEAYRIESKFCLKCGTALPSNEKEPRRNTCTNPDCNLYKSKFIYPDDARFCDVCGSKTVYAN